jgi:hypothetical protein
MDNTLTESAVDETVVFLNYTPTLGEPEKAPCESVLPRF